MSSENYFCGLFCQDKNSQVLNLRRTYHHINLAIVLKVQSEFLDYLYL